MPFQYAADPDDLELLKRVAAPDLPFVDLSSPVNGNGYAADTLCIDDDEDDGTSERDDKKEVEASYSVSQAQDARAGSSRTHVAHIDPVQAAQDEDDVQKVSFCLITH